MRLLIMILSLSTLLHAWNLSMEDTLEADQWMQDQIEEELKPFQEGIARIDVKKSYAAIEKSFAGAYAPIAYVKFARGRSQFQIPKKCLPFLKKRAEHFCHALERLHKIAPLSNFELLLSLDQCFERPYHLHLSNVPVFTMSKSQRNKQVLLFPRGVLDPDREKKQAAILQQAVSTPFQDRQPKIYWRLTTFDRSAIEFDWRLGPTIPLLYLAQNNPEQLDFKIPECSKQFISAKIRGPLSRHIYAVGMDETEFINYRYLLALDQRSTPRDFENHLFSGSIIMRAATNFSDCFTRLLKPYQHYIPLDKRGEGVFDALLWCEQNNQALGKIAEAAQTFAKEQLSDRQIFKYFHHLIDAYTTLLNGDESHE